MGWQGEQTFLPAKSDSDTVAPVCALHENAGAAAPTVTPIVHGRATAVVGREKGLVGFRRRGSGTNLRGCLHFPSKSAPKCITCNTFRVSTSPVAGHHLMPVSYRRLANPHPVASEGVSRP